MILAGLAAAGLASLSSAGLGRLTADEIRIELTVIDERGRPLDGATIWYFGDTGQRQDLRVEDMRRLVARHSRDLDFVFENFLHPNLLIEWTQATGRVTVVRERQEVGNLDAASTYMAVLKRGYLPAVIQRREKPGNSVKVTVQLKPDASVKVDPRMETFDHLRALAFADSDPEVMMSAQYRSSISGISSQMRELAETQEKEGQSDNAAAIFFNLAYLPGATYQTDASGGLVIRGYTRGFDESSPQRVADRSKAWSLVRRPALEYQKLREQAKADGLLSGPSPARDSVRIRFLADTERLFGEAPEQMWASFHETSWDMYDALRRPDKACDALQAFYQFEPSYYNAAGWQRQLKSHEAGIKVFQSTPTRKCELPLAND